MFQLQITDDLVLLIILKQVRGTWVLFRKVGMLIKYIYDKLLNQISSRKDFSYVNYCQCCMYFENCTAFDQMLCEELS